MSCARCGGRLAERPTQLLDGLVVAEYRCRDCRHDGARVTRPDGSERAVGSVFGGGV